MKKSFSAPFRRIRSHSSAHLRIYNRTMLGLFVLYIFASLMSVWQSQGNDWPFFSGHWFYKVPVEISDYSILITELDGQPVEPSQYAEKLYRRLSGWPFDIYGSIQQWGQAKVAKLPNEARFKQMAINNAFGRRQFRGHLVKRNIDTLDFVENGHVKQFELVEEIQSK